MALAAIPVYIIKSNFIPVRVQNATTEDVKFADWKGNGENPIAEIEGEVLLRTNVNGNELTSNQLKMLLNEDGIEVLGKKETLDIMTNKD